MTDIINLEEDRPVITYEQLNSDQKNAVDEFFTFMFSPAKVFHLRGPAGVGKTFVLNYIMNTIYHRYFDACKALNIEPEYNDIGLTATTNKAAEVLSVACNREAQTIHSYLNLKVQEDYKTGETKLTMKNSYHIIHNTILFIDEASMIDYKLKKIIEETMHKSKIVYIGDHCQMAPVFEDVSQIYNDMPFAADLTIPVRNSNQPALMALCTQLRATVETGVFNQIQPVPGVIEYLGGAEMQHLIDTQFKQEGNDSRILCYTNKQVNDYNDYIRAIRGYGNEFEVGERLVAASTYEFGKQHLSVEEEVEVLEVDPSPFTKDVQGTEFDVYKAKIQSKKNWSRMEVMIPHNRKHFDELVKHFARAKKWSAYFFLKNSFPDLRPRDACTVYKAQGSTYESVFLDLENISTCTQAKQVARMLYVGVSRPRTKLYLYGNLKPAYGGL